MFPVPPDASGRLPQSLYAETAQEPVPTPRLEGEARADVVVVGAGFTGLSAALHLAERGVGTLVLDAREPGWGASGRNGGQVNPGLKHEPEAIERALGVERGRRLAAFAGGAPDLVFDLVRRHGIPCEANQSGTIRVAYAAASADGLRRATEGWQRRGAPVTLLERAAMATASGTDRYICGARDARGGSLHPLRYARGLARVAAGAGARLHGKSPATAVSRQGEGWVVSTPHGRVTADWLVLATNGYTDGLWPGLARTIVPVYSGIVASAPLPEAVARRILPGREVLYEHEAITVYYRVDAAGRLLMGGRSRLRPLEGPAAFGDLVRIARRLWPFLGDIQWTHGWNGQLAVTTDHYPHWTEPAPNVIACLGYNGRGIAMATAMGGEIARRVTGTPAADLVLPVTPLRPLPLHGLWPLAVTARIAYGRAIGRVLGAMSRG